MGCSMLILGSAILSLSACRWVKVNDEGARVALRTSAEVGSCKRVGEVSSATLAKLLIVRRNPRKVAEEVITLAKNQAAKLGGNAIVGKGEVIDGAQDFDVYRCP